MQEIVVDGLWFVAGNGEFSVIRWSVYRVTESSHGADKRPSSSMKILMEQINGPAAL